MNNSPRLLATLSRYGCGDLGQIEGERQDVLDKIQKRAESAQKPFHVNIRGLDNNWYLTEELQNYVAMPGGEMQKILPLEPQDSLKT